MRRIILAIATTAAVIVLLFSYRTSSLGPTATGGAKAASAHVVAAGPSASAPRSSAPQTSAPQTSATPSPSVPTKVDGKLVQTGYGPIVVEIVVTGSRISDAQAVTFPDAAGRTRSISASALPVLRSETLKAQGAKIDGVSGATHTSDGYIASLQSALDLVGLK